MVALPRRLNLLLSAATLLIGVTALAAGLNSRLLSRQSLEVLEIDSRKPTHRILAELKSFLMDQPVSVGVEGGNPRRAEERAILQAIDMWQEALPDSPFVYAEPEEKPDVAIRFVDRIESDALLQGQIEMDRRFSWGKSRHSYRLSALMQVRDVFRSRKLTGDELASVIAHELGHVVGLEDVSDPDALMGPFVSGRSTARIGSDELLAVRDFRLALRDKIRQVERR